MIPVINVKTKYSFLESLLKLDEYITFAKKNNWNGIFICDNNLHGIASFYNKAIKNKIKPIIALNCFLTIATKKINLNLVAKNNQGYLNLLKISENIYNKNLEINLELFLKYCNNLYIIVNLSKSFDLNLFLKKIPESIIKEFVYFGIFKNFKGLDVLINNKIILDKIILNNEVNYLNLKDDKTCKILYLIKNKKLMDLNKLNIFSLKKTFLDFKELQYFFDIKLDKYKTIFMKNLDFIIKNCNINIYFKVEKELNIAKYQLDSNNVNNLLLLKDLCIKRLNKLNLNNKIYQNRLKQELEVILNKKFIDYFLIVYDYVNYAKKNNIMVGPGRGSAAGSLVAYLLNITMVDPIKYDLLFERFLNNYRTTMPDIDVDFEDIKRDKIINYLYKKYGKDKFATIATFQRIGIRTAIRDCGRIYGIDLETINKICNFIPLTTKIDYNIEQLLENNKQLKYYYDKYQELFFHTKKIMMLPRQVSSHASGIIIVASNLLETIPVYQTFEGYYQTQFEFKYLEQFQIVKMDILGLKNLTIINNIINSFYKDKKQKLLLENIPLNDKKTFELLRLGHTNGIFQLESDGMKNTLNKLKVSKFNDIALTLAIYRPGPMENIHSYIEKKKQSLKFYFNFKITNILKNTFGIIVYQEQVMMIAKYFASFNLKKADLLRIAISKKKVLEMKKLEKDFFIGAKSNGYKEKNIKEIWNLINKFANYGFNKSHAVSYGKIAYWMAYLKANYSKYFFASLLSNYINNTTKTLQYINELKTYNLKLVLPSINFPFLNYQSALNQNIIYPSLLIIKNINVLFIKSIKKILKKYGPFKDIFDFFVKTFYLHISELQYYSLVYSNALRCFGYNKETLIKNYLFLNNYARLCNNDQKGLFNNKKDLIFEIQEFQDKDIFSNALLEKKYIGFYLAIHPLEIIAKKYHLLNCTRLNEIVFNKNNQISKTYNILVIISKITKIKDKDNNDMAFLTVYDQTSKIEIIVFSSVYSIYFTNLKEKNVINATVKANIYKNKFNLILKKFRILKFIL